MCITGNGSTFGLADGPVETAPSGIGRLLSASGFSAEITDIEDSDLSTTDFTEYCPGDFAGHEPITYGVATEPNTQGGLAFNNLGKVYVGTHTFKLQPGQTTPASITGSGYLMKSDLGDGQNNERMEGEVVWRFDNKSTPIAFTPAA